MPPEVQHSQLPTQSHSPTSQNPSGIALSVTDLCVTLVSRPATIPRVYKQILRQLLKLRKRAQTTLNIESSHQESNNIYGESNNKNSGKPLLRNVNFRVDPGQGGSGSGKTMLLNVITGNMNNRHATISGDILFNGETSKTYRKNGLIGYLQQEDYLLPFITVRETLRFAADLRLPTLTKQEKEDLIESLLLELGLKNCGDTRVGDAHGCEVGQGGTRGISGGERRRVSAAIQLLTRPNLLVCDEVTSGLDAFTALELVKTLNTYARSSHSTVLLSIHQPRSEIFHLLSMTGGQLVILSRGNVVYSGPMDRLLSWFVSVGLGQCPEHVNPLDYALDNCDSVPPNTAPGLPENAVAGGIGETDPSLQTNTSCSRMLPSRSHTTKHTCNSDVAQSLIPGQARLWQQVMVLCNRHWLKMQRNALLIWGFLAIHTFLAVSVSIVFWKLDSELASIRARASVCYLLYAFQPYLTMATGFIVPTSQIPHLLRWLKHISFHRLAYQILISLEFTDRHFDCPYKRSQIIDGAIVETADLGRCSFWDGNTVLQGQLEGSIGFFPIPIAYIALHFLVYIIAAWTVLSMMPVDHLHSTSNQSPIEYVLRLVLCLFYNKESFSSKPNVEGKTFKSRKDDGPVEGQSDTILKIDEEERRQRQPVTIAVKDLSVHVAQTPNLQFKHTIQKPLLQNISFEAPAAQLTAILGGSGSGKTTLLNALLHRNSSRVSGDIYFNGVKVLSKSKINAICGYVRQDDGFLMSHLTVRETLRYATELGMEKPLPVAEKWRKAEEIMDLMGLRECADVMVGGEGFSGCSGGQRRRVSIGMQLVIEPACLFLDEPTSGLDALTDIWNELDNVLLLMTGGRLAYAGKTDEALGYFEQAGYAPLKHMNPPVLFFWKLDPTPVGLLNRLGLFHQLMGATLAGVMVHTEVFPEESAIAFREISDGRYSTTSFLLSYMINELPLSLISASFSAGIIFLVTGLQTNATSVASMVLVMFAYITTGESLGIAYSACFRAKGGLGVAFMNSTVLWMSFMAGFLVPKLPLALRYFKYASIFSYSAKMVSLNEFRGLSVVGGSSGSSDFMTKNVQMTTPSPLLIPFQNGEAVLQFLNFEVQSLQVSIGMLITLMVIYRVMAWAALVVRARFSR
ncbi:hypothetical protein BGZ80_010841 [Entomortierella chlamydospora]|uniref:ABC transporter domain-containing protein n=1 Tax=Entomortierella chlamydospora TaxID=101097 RepID=A0A9P6N439_9FUNG|nr:hypothetical protein BGZ80_010841 [Entomortierella chlamydospora]